MTRFRSVDYRIPGLTFARWEPCTRCSGRPMPGTLGLLAYWREQVPHIARKLGVSGAGFAPLGIYNCRPVRGGTSMSVHACGRAVDLGNPVTVAGHRVQIEFLRMLAGASPGGAAGLGLQLVIFSRQSGSARHPWPTRYTGADPHDNHPHVEQTLAAAQVSAERMLVTLRSRCGDLRTIARPPAQSLVGGIVNDLPVIRLDGIVNTRPSTWPGYAQRRSGGLPEVRTYQGGLAARGFYGGDIDGIAGPVTGAASDRLQSRHDTGGSDGRPDRIVGRRTWHAALGVTVPPR